MTDRRQVLGENETPVREQDKVMLRLPDGMRDRLKAAAAINKRSMNAEIVARLDDSFNSDLGESLDDIRHRVFQGEADIADIPSPDDVLSAELRKAIAATIQKTLDELNYAGFVTMLYDVEKDEDQPMFFNKYPKRSREELLAINERLAKARRNKK